MTDMAELGKRAVATEGWRWMPGMLTHEGWRVVIGRCSHDPSWFELGSSWSGKVGAYNSAGSTPDFDDPATLGCLLALVREKNGKFCHTGGDSSGWDVFWSGDHRWVSGATEAEALVSALEALKDHP